MINEDGTICEDCYSANYCKECGKEYEESTEGVCYDCMACQFLEELNLLFEKFDVVVYSDFGSSVGFNLYDMKEIVFPLGIFKLDIKGKIKELQNDN